MYLHQIVTKFDKQLVLPGFWTLVHRLVFQKEGNISETDRLPKHCDPLSTSSSITTVQTFPAFSARTETDPVSEMLCSIPEVPKLLHLAPPPPQDFALIYATRPPPKE
jgi:hypothetical protein